MVNFRKVFFIGLRICTDFVSLFLVHVLSGRKGFIHLPPVKDKYLLMSVQELVSDIKAGKVSTELNAIDDDVVVNLFYIFWLD